MQAYIMVDALRVTGSLLCCQPEGAGVAGIDSGSFKIFATDLQIMNERLLKILNNREQNYPHALEKQFPRILEKIMSLWESAEFDAYLADLMTTTRTNRQGFPQAVASDIIYLNMVHESKDEQGNPVTWAQRLRDDQT
jgi:hypothetical protein